MFTPAERHFFSARFSSRTCTTNSSSSSLSRFPGKSRFALPGADFARGRERKRAKDESDSRTTTFVSELPAPSAASIIPNTKHLLLRFRDAFFQHLHDLFHFNRECRSSSSSRLEYCSISKLHSKILLQLMIMSLQYLMLQIMILFFNYLFQILFFLMH